MEEGQGKKERKTDGRTGRGTDRDRETEKGGFLEGGRRRGQGKR